MAAEDSSSTGILKVDEEELFSVESCWVEARTTCDHLSFKSSYYDSMYLEIKTNQGNFRCHHPAENWLCFSCKDIFCNRFINKHMVNHHQEIGHCLALSFRILKLRR
ncbi:RING finger protein ETP1-like isoform X1 [Zingiber officinale]|uniref:RING finger protein ETP1-like isoform X1 n=1 Tax=Zingiber officinale TaxID=94328 RepID=UPI001C4B1C1E|nr:RING finger protein ETP1-like isoform X1 [Zingiber officinale]